METKQIFSEISFTGYCCHCVKSVQIRPNLFELNTGKKGPEKTPYLDTFHAVCDFESFSLAMLF